MKICYIYISNQSTIKTGVDHKIIGKCLALNSFFPKSKFVRFVTEVKQYSPEEKNENLFEIREVNIRDKKYFRDFFYKKDLFNSITQFINSNREKVDFYIMRYPFASFSLLKFLKKNPKKIIFEHNTNEEAELKIIIKANKKLIPFKINPSVFSYYITSVFFLSWIEKYIGAKCLKYAAAGLVVTPEIGELEKKRYKYYKTFTLTNGISPNQIGLNNNRENNDILNGIFLAGTNAVWHGIERIINSFELATTKKKIHLYFIGRIDEKLIQKYSNNECVFFINYLSKMELLELLNKMHFAIGTCALYKTGLVEGAVLKVREYLSVGLPVVLGYDDSYIRSISELYKYCIQFPADDSNIDFDYIHAQVNKFYENDFNLNSTIQQAATKYLSWEKVLSPLPAFLHSI